MRKIGFVSKVYYILGNRKVKVNRDMPFFIESHGSANIQQNVGKYAIN